MLIPLFLRPVNISLGRRRSKRLPHGDIPPTIDAIKIHVRGGMETGESLER